MRRRDKFPYFFNSTIGVTQGCPLSPTPFNLCIDELDKMIAKFVKEEGVEEVAIGNVAIMLLLYVDDAVFSANTLGDAQKLTKALENFCIHTKLSVNSSKTNIMFLKSQKKISHALCTIMSHLNVWKASNILALKFLQIIDGVNVLYAA